MEIHRLRYSTDKEENEWGYAKGISPFIDYICEDKSKYTKLSETFNPNINRNWVDKDDDFIIGNSGGILMNIDFVFIGVDIFSKVAEFYTKHGCYTLAPEDTPDYTSFWLRETSRRKKGVIAKCKLLINDIPKYISAKTEEERKDILQPLRITGDHYNYLNYGRIERVPNEEERKMFDSQGAFKVETIEGFPRFWDGDYWNFKLDELISINKYNLTKSKARRKGFSYKRGSQAANTLNLFKDVTVILAADILDYLTDKGATSYMVKTNLDWFETQTYWVRGYLSENFSKGIELGYKKSKEGQKSYGFRSKLLSIAIGKNESAAVGKKAIEIDFEEAGKCPNLQKALNVTMSNNESGGNQIGTIRVYGTGGTKGVNWEAFRDCFYNPKKNNMLALENIWDKNQRFNTCGFFFPQIWDYEPFVEDGNSLLFDSYKDDKRRKDAAKSELRGEDFTIFMGQRANAPSEAFVNTMDNIFESPELNDHILEVQNNNQFKFYKDGWYVSKEGKVEFVEKTECIYRNIFGNNKFHDYITDVPHNNRTDIHGCIREYYPPVYTNSDIYFISVDTFRVDKHINVVTDKHSLYSFKVWTRHHDLSNVPSKAIVAEYCGRLNTMEECDRVLLYAALRYNAKVLIEAGTGDTVTNFKNWGYKRLLLKDPNTFINRSINPSLQSNYGIIIGDGETKLDGLRMLKDFLYEPIGRNEDDGICLRLHTIYSSSFLLELQNFNLSQNFDRISDAIVAMFEFKKDKLLYERKVKKGDSNNENSMFKRLMDKS